MARVLIFKEVWIPFETPKSNLLKSEKTIKLIETYGFGIHWFKVSDDEILVGLRFLTAWGWVAIGFVRYGDEEMKMGFGVGRMR